MGRYLLPKVSFFVLIHIFLYRIYLFLDYSRSLILSLSMIYSSSILLSFIVFIRLFGKSIFDVQVSFSASIFVSMFFCRVDYFLDHSCSLIFPLSMLRNYFLFLLPFILMSLLLLLLSFILLSTSAVWQPRLSDILKSKRMLL